MSVPLESFPIVSTNCADEAQSILSHELSNLRITNVADGRLFHFEMNGVHLGRTMVGYNRFKTDTSIVNVGDIDEAIVLVMGIGPRAVMYVDGRPIVRAGKGAMLSPPRRVVIHRPADGGILIIKAGREALDARLRETMGRRPRKPIVFDRSVDLAKGAGASVRRLVGFLADESQQDSAILENPLLRVGLDEMLLNGLLALPNNYSEELVGGRRLSITSSVVRRAEEFMDAHATKPITIADVVAQCGCSRRVLFSAFRSFRGYTPMEFLAEYRLKSVRKALQDPTSTKTVTSIALACGFAHLGRFSEAYLKRFGERPSETLRKARDHHTLNCTITPTRH